MFQYSWQILYYRIKNIGERMKLVLIPWTAKLFGRSIQDLPQFNFKEIELTLSRYISSIEMVIYDVNSSYSGEDWFFFWEITDVTESVYLKLFDQGFISHTIVYIAEPDVVIEWHNFRGVNELKKYFHYIVTWNKDFIDYKRVYPLQSFYKWEYMLHESNSVDEVSFSDKKLMTCIVGYKKSNVRGELYSERLKVIKWFEENHPEDFEFYGAGWPQKEYPLYRGCVDSKVKTYQMYRFALCIENISKENMITEKPMDCFSSMIVPIYYGAPEMETYVPHECYIDYRDFKNLEELYSFIKNMPEEQYNGYIKAIKKFTEIGEMAYFSPEENAKGLLGILQSKEKDCFEVTKYIITKAKIKRILYITRQKFRKKIHG